MAKLDLIYSGSPLSIAKLPMGRNNLKNFLGLYASRDIVRFYDDYLGNALVASNWAVANSGGAGAANFATNVQQNGVVRGTTGTTDNGSVSKIGPLIWLPNNNAGAEWRFKIDVVTGLNFEVGFIDAVPGSNGSGVSDVDTPAATMTDGAVLQMDTDQTLATLAFVTAKSGATTQATTAVSTTVPTAATYMTVRIEFRGGVAECWINGVKEAAHSAAVTGATALGLWTYVRTRNTTTHLFDEDYCLAWAERA